MSEYATKAELDLVREHQRRDTDRLAKAVEDLTKAVAKLEVRVGQLGTKSGAWGLAAGALPIVIALGIYALRSAE